MIRISLSCTFFLIITVTYFQLSSLLWNTLKCIKLHFYTAVYVLLISRSPVIFIHILCIKFFCAISNVFTNI